MTLMAHWWHINTYLVIQLQLYLGPSWCWYMKPIVWWPTLCSIEDLTPWDREEMGGPSGSLSLLASVLKQQVIIIALINTQIYQMSPDVGIKHLSAVKGYSRETNNKRKCPTWWVASSSLRCWHWERSNIVLSIPTDGCCCCWSHISSLIHHTVLPALICNKLSVSVGDKKLIAGHRCNSAAVQSSQICYYIAVLWTTIFRKIWPKYQYDANLIY